MEVARVAITDAAAAVLRQLVAQHGPLAGVRLRRAGVAGCLSAGAGRSALTRAPLGTEAGSVVCCRPFLTPMAARSGLPQRSYHVTG